MNIIKRVDWPTMYRNIDFSVIWAPCSDEEGEVPMDLSGYTAAVDLREGKEATDTLIIAMTAVITSAVVSGVTWWYVTVSLTNTQTGTLTSYDEGYYGLLLTNAAGVSEPWLWGKVKINDKFPTPES